MVGEGEIPLSQNKKLGVEDMKINDAIHTTNPIASWKKTIKAKVAVWTYDSITEKPEQVILYGDGEDSQYHAYTDVEVTFFKRMNKKAIAQGLVIEFTPENSDLEIEYEFLANATDAQLKEFLSQSFLKMKKDLKKVTSEAVMVRLLRIATEEEKSETILNLLREKLSEIQAIPIIKEEE
jgi:hypothetical protein